MHCTGCGTQLPDKSKFCSSCGGAIAEESIPSTKDEPTQANQNLTKSQIFSGLFIGILGISFMAWITSDDSGSVSVFSSGLDADISYCEHSIKDCKWHDLMDNVAACTFANTASIPVNTRQFFAWSYSNSGVMLKKRQIGTDNVSPGRSVKVELMFDMDTDRGYVCSMDPESDIGKATLGGTLKPLPIR